MRQIIRRHLLRRRLLRPRERRLFLRRLPSRLGARRRPRVRRRRVRLRALRRLALLAVPVRRPVRVFFGFLRRRGLLGRFRRLAFGFLRAARARLRVVEFDASVEFSFASFARARGSSARELARARARVARALAPWTACRVGAASVGECGGDGAGRERASASATAFRTRANHARCLQTTANVEQFVQNNSRALRGKRLEDDDARVRELPVRRLHRPRHRHARATIPHDVHVVSQSFRVQRGVLDAKIVR